MKNTIIEIDHQLIKEELNKMADSLPLVDIAKVEDDSEKVVLYFTVQGYDVNVELKKVDTDNLKGSLMGMFEAKGARVKE